jgi:VanZ family protein
VRGSPLARILLAAYVLLTAYASLYPLSGWREPAGSSLAFLVAAWPRYVTWFDLVVNFLGYLPYGVLAALAARPRFGAGAAVALATASGAAMSLGLETGQMWLPARIPSNLDVLVNAAGAAAGGLVGGQLAPWLLEGGPLRAQRAELFAPGAVADFGLALVGLWLFAQLNPTTLLFGTGDLRDFLVGPAGPAYGAELFVAVEAVVAAANLAALGLLVSAMARPGAPVAVLLVALVAAALVVKTLAFALLMQAENVFAWVTPGAQAGLVGGLAAMLLGSRLPRTARLVVAALLLMAATALVNTAPPNPYLAAILKVWGQGHFLNFNGLTRLVSAAWPFAALGCAILLAARRGGRDEVLG